MGWSQLKTPRTAGRLLRHTENRVSWLEDVTGNVARKGTQETDENKKSQVRNAEGGWRSSRIASRRFGRKGWKE